MSLLFSISSQVMHNMGFHYQKGEMRIIPLCSPLENVKGNGGGGAGGYTKHYQQKSCGKWKPLRS